MIESLPITRETRTSKYVESPMWDRKTFKGFMEEHLPKLARNQGLFFDNPTDIGRLNALLFSVGQSTDAFAHVASVAGCVLPLVNLKPVADGLPHEKIGFMNMNRLQFFLRPGFGNVVSCHEFRQNNPYHPYGQLGYINNPYWCCFGIYKDADSVTTYPNDYGQQVFKPEDVRVPNLVATANVLIGYDSDNHASAMISRAYGQINHHDLTRLVLWLRDVCNLKVYMVSNYYGGNGGHDHPHGSLVQLLGGTAAGQTTSTIKSIPVPILAGYTRRPGVPLGHRLDPIFRYDDIAAPKYHKSSTFGHVVVTEEHTRCVLITAPRIPTIVSANRLERLSQLYNCGTTTVRVAGSTQGTNASFVMRDEGCNKLMFCGDNAPAHGYRKGVVCPESGQNLIGEATYNTMKASNVDLPEPITVFPNIDRSIFRELRLRAGAVTDTVPGSVVTRTGRRATLEDIRLGIPAWEILHDDPTWVEMLAAVAVEA